MLWMALDALSPLDGRYLDSVAPLRTFFSESAFHRSRLELEIRYLEALGRFGLITVLDVDQADFLMSFSPEDAQRIKELEQTTRHDVKAIEYFLRERIQGALDPDLKDLRPYLHFGLTSEDVNNLAQSLALRDSRDQVLLPALDELLGYLRDFARRFRSTPMLARTHGQPAVPTTLGKEFALFFERLRSCREKMAAHRFEGKLTGAVGNFNALQAALPELAWMDFSRDFVGSLGLEPSLYTTQILPLDNWIRYFQALHLLNSILIDLARDIWRYISDGYLVQSVKPGEVGSSTMPQKVNPIDFENAEGNAGLANALFSHYTEKLPISRLQRDLSDTTVRRTFGVALGHALLAWQNLARGMTRLAVDEEKLASDLQAHWEVVSEGAQTILRLSGRMDAYESLLALARGRILTEFDYKSWAISLDVDEGTRQRLLSLSPETYLGLAVQIVDQIIAGTIDTKAESS